MKFALEISRATFILPAIFVWCCSAGAARAPSEHDLSCAGATVVRTSLGPTLRSLGPGRRVKAVRWALSDGHLYLSQTLDEDRRPGKITTTAAQELQPPGAAIVLCVQKVPAGPYDYLIRTKDRTNRAAKRLR